MENKEVRVYGVVLSLSDKFKYLSEIPGGEVKKYETLLTSLSRYYEELGIDISELQPVFLCFKEKPGSIDFYYALPVDLKDLQEFIKENTKGLEIIEHIDKTLEKEIFQKIIKR